MADLFIQTEAAAVGADLLIFQLAEEQDAAHKGGQTLGVEEDLLHIFRLLLIEILAALQQHGIALDGVDGGLELVGDIGDEVRLEHFDGAELVGHHVEARVDLHQLLGGGLIVQPHGKVTVCHLFHGICQLMDGIEILFGEDRRHHKTHDHTRDIPCHQHPRQQGVTEVGTQQKPDHHGDKAADHQLRRHHNGHADAEGDLVVFHLTDALKQLPRAERLRLLTDGFQQFSGIHSLTTL